MSHIGFSQTDQSEAACRRATRSCDPQRHCSAAIGLGLRLWFASWVLWALGHMAAYGPARRDPSFVEVVRWHVRYPTHLGS
jgi:hypothetical protein